jgi:molybdopterin/thiamine biosynthesis adenylyltransferase
MTARFVRQMLLPEIGIEGQARIGQATAAVAGASPAHAVARLYAEGAGFGAVTAGAIDAAALAPEAIVTSPAAREVLAGSRAALAAIRRAAQQKDPAS